MQEIVDAAPTPGEGARVQRMISAMVSTGFNGGYVANPRLAKVVQGLRVHGQRREKGVVRLADRPPRRVLVDDPGPQFLEPPPALPDDRRPGRLAHIPSH
jgi:hypothetical protein